MEEQRRKQELAVEEAKQALVEIEEGRKTEYWRLLDKKIKRWIEAEERYLDSFKRSGLDAEKLVEYNMATERLGLMRNFKDINDILKKENEGFINKIVVPSQQLSQYQRTFV